MTIDQINHPQDFFFFLSRLKLLQNTYFIIQNQFKCFVFACLNEFLIDFVGIKENFLKIFKVRKMIKIEFLYYIMYKAKLFRQIYGIG